MTIMTRIREIREKRRQKAFIIATLFIMLFVFVLAGCSCRKNEPVVSTGSGTGQEAEANTATGKDGEAGQLTEGGATGTGKDGETGQLTEEGATGTGTNAGNGQGAAEISLIMVGDVLLHDRVENSARQADGSYDFSAIFARTKEDIAAADLAIVNQEVIIGGSELGISGYPAFNAPYEVGKGLVEAGFDVVCHGTNHALDKGKKGLLNCINFWKTNYPQIAVLGIYESAEERDSLYIYEQDGIKIAILNYTYGTNGISRPEGMPYAVNMLEEAQVVADIKRAEAEADFTIVCPHWGTEYQLTPSSQQKKWTGIFLEQGVDLVLGTHPHVIEPVEWVTDKNTGHQMLVYYSIGNYVNWTSGTGAGVSNRMVGGMAKVTLGRDNASEPVKIKEYGVEPLVSHVQSGINGVQVYRLADYNAQLAEQNEIRTQASDFSYEYCVNLCNQVWGELWKK